MAMKNKEQQQAELRSKIVDALKRNNDEELAGVLSEMASAMQENVLDEARSAMATVTDKNVLVQRGAKVLTTEERNYYDSAIEKRGFVDLDATMPVTIFDRVFEDLTQNHPLLSKIKFENTTATSEWIIRKTNCENAWWGKLTDSIKKELEHGFDKVKTGMYKLSAYMPVSEAMLDLGAEWLDRYVRVVLAESLSLALELGIVAGTGKDQPIGMMKNLKGAVVEGVYADKDAVVLEDLKPNTLGKKVMAPLTKEGTRNVTDVLMLVNPLDYWEKLFGATTALTMSGTYAYGILPIPGDIVQSIAVPRGRLIAGMAQDYFMGVGSTGKIEYSDEYKFLEDERTYLAKQYANGQPKDNDSFIVFNIENLKTDLETPVTPANATTKALEKAVKAMMETQMQLIEANQNQARLIESLMVVEESVEESNFEKSK